MACQVEGLPLLSTGGDHLPIACVVEDAVSRVRSEPGQLSQLNKKIQQKTDASELICSSEDAQAMIDSLDRLRRDGCEYRAEISQLIASFAEHKVLAAQKDLSSGFRNGAKTRFVNGTSKVVNADKNSLDMPCGRHREVEPEQEEIRNETGGPAYMAPQKVGESWRDNSSTSDKHVTAGMPREFLTQPTEEKQSQHPGEPPANEEETGAQSEAEDNMAYEGDAEGGFASGAEMMGQEDGLKSSPRRDLREHDRDSRSDQGLQPQSDSSSLSDTAQSDVAAQQKLAVVEKTDAAHQTAIIAQKRENVPCVQRNRKIDSVFHPTERACATQDYPDVMLDVPSLAVDDLALEVNNLRAHVSLDARVASLMQISAGVDAAVDNVRLTLRGVRANALLNVRLDNVREMVNKALEAAVRDPALMCRILDAAEEPPRPVGPAGDEVHRALPHSDAQAEVA